MDSKHATSTGGEGTAAGGWEAVFAEEGEDVIAEIEKLIKE